jgi:glycine cleavage system transcriptional repressor
MARFSLHTVGRDRSGIVASVTDALAGLGANLEESNMTILHGQSAIMLVLEVPDVSDGRLIEGALEQVAEEFSLFVTVCPMPEDPVVELSGPTFLISVDGPYRPGIVVGVTKAIAELNANVIDLTFRPVRRDGHTDYVLRLSVVLPPGMEIGALEDALGDVGHLHQVEYSIRPWSGELPWDATK